MQKQEFKSIYFLSVDDAKQKGRSVTISFSEEDADLQKRIATLSNHEIREIIGISQYEDLLEKAEKDRRSVSQYIKLELARNIYKEASIKTTDVTFQKSKNIPFQRWFPLAEGYSSDFVSKLLAKYCPSVNSIYEPFAGTGSTIFAVDEKSLKAFYSEVNPLMVFLSEVKFQILLLLDKERQKLADDLNHESLSILKNLVNFEEDQQLKNNYQNLFGKSKYFDDHTFEQILRLRTYIDSLAERDFLLSKVVTIAIVGILLKISYLKKVGDVRFKTSDEMKRENYRLEEELLVKLDEVISDISNHKYRLNSKPEFLCYNAKKVGFLQDLKIDAVITSPPYLNGTNYLRNTKIELWFLRYIQYPDDLRGLRDQIITSGINDVKARNGQSLKEQNDFESPLLKQTLVELNKKTYDSRIPLMVDSYFHEMFSVFSGLRKHLTREAKLLIDIGDSIFADVHVPTDNILIQILEPLGYQLFDKIVLRKRRSRNQTVLTQVLLAFKYEPKKQQFFIEAVNNRLDWNEKWTHFKKVIPHQQMPYLKKNWGHQNHSLCSYGGKLKPAIARFLVDTFVPKGGRLFDPFSGVGTIPFEGALSGRKAFGMDISLPAFYISASKVAQCDKNLAYQYLDKIRGAIEKDFISENQIACMGKFGFNKSLIEYYEEKTLKEVLLARNYVKHHPPTSPSEMIVVSCLLHVLHGNRPYALSRRSHPITPYAPIGKFEYKNVYEKVKDKLDKSLNQDLPNDFCPGEVYLHDSTQVWPQAIDNLDAIITSPPFFDSTRFYLANWLRIWFCGWEDKDFRSKPALFIEERQKLGFDAYDNIFRQARERLRPKGVLVFHLGKSKKCDMASKILEQSKRYFKNHDLFDECVKHCQSHGIRDKGTVTSHQYLVLY